MMRLASQTFVSFALAGALFAIPQVGFCTSSSHPSHYVGTYESAVPEGLGKGSVMSLSLGKDGGATLMQDWGKGAKTTFGHWNDQGGQIQVIFDAIKGQPAEPPMTFESGHGGLRAVNWDHSKWGKATPPPMKKTSGDWHTRRRRFW